MSKIDRREFLAGLGAVVGLAAIGQWIAELPVENETPEPDMHGYFSWDDPGPRKGRLVRVHDVTLSFTSDGGKTWTKM
jgi:hypothetical protein